MTLDEIRAKYANEEWEAVTVTTNGAEDTYAFRGSTLAEQGLVRSKVAENKSEEGLLDLISACCLTHTRDQLTKLISARSGFTTIATQAINDASSGGMVRFRKK